MSDSAGYLGPPPDSEAGRAMLEEDLAEDGFVMNLTRVWAHDPPLQPALMQAAAHAASLAGLSLRQRGVLVSAAASALGDSYCSLAWGQRLADEAGPDVAVAVLSGGKIDDEQDRALAHWARDVIRNPNDISADDVESLRRVGFDDRQILGITAYVAVRLAFSTVNDALGAVADRELIERAAPAVRAAVSYGRLP